MKESNIKELWKSGTDSNTKSYSDSELNEIIVRTAKKSMKAVQLDGVFQYVVIAVVVYLIFTLLFRNNSLEMKLLDFAGLTILLLCAFFWKRSDYKMGTYKCDMPVKEWLEYRINELNKTVYRKRKYNRLIICLSLLLGFGFHVVQQMLVKAPFNPILSGSIFIALVIFCVFITRSLNGKYRKTRDELKELYRQFEESN